MFLNIRIVGQPQAIASLGRESSCEFGSREVIAIVSDCSVTESRKTPLQYRSLNLRLSLHCYEILGKSRVNSHAKTIYDL
jgi:hypothetical protein